MSEKAVPVDLVFLCVFLRFLVEPEFSDVPNWHCSEGEGFLLLRNITAVVPKLKSCSVIS